MIEIIDKRDCVGCNGCKQSCPRDCINMSTDEQGFNYPKVDLEQCINCNICEKVCPVINPGPIKQPLVTYAARNKNYNIMKASSSGGIFYSLAERIIKAGGIVFGAKYDTNWNVLHGYVDSIEELRLFMTSKYVQSSIGNCYKEVEYFLKHERTVLFTGTPCQILGLKRFLRKDYGNRLLTAEIICHGVPSPKIWKEYLDYIQSKNKLGDIQDISFRDKTNGWKNYSIKIQGSEKTYLKSHRDDSYMQGFLQDLFLRPSCTNCPAKSLKSESDISMGDFWHYISDKSEFNENTGLSVLLINTKEGLAITENLDFERKKEDYALATDCVHAIVRSAKESQFSQGFWIGYNKHGIAFLPNYIRGITPLKAKIKRFVKRVIKHNN